MEGEDMNNAQGYSLTSFVLGLSLVYKLTQGIYANSEVCEWDTFYTATSSQTPQWLLFTATPRGLLTHTC